MFFSQNKSVANSLSLSTYELYFGYTAGSQNVTVTISPSGSVPVITDDALWITTSYSAPTLTISVTAHKLGYPNRFGNVTVTHPDDAGIFQEILISQGEIL